MSSKEAARQRLQLRRAKVSTRDTAIISEFERACWLLVPVFGAMWLAIALLIIGGVVA